MGKVLSADELLKLAKRVLPAKEATLCQRMLETSMTSVALLVAKKMDLVLLDASYEPGFGGLCVDFSAQSIEQAENPPRIWQCFDREKPIKDPPDEPEDEGDVEDSDRVALDPGGDLGPIFGNPQDLPVSTRRRMLNMKRTKR